MAPKTSKTTASDDVTSGTTLTPKETQILLAVVSLMPEVPDVNFEDVAKLVKIKYSKNARAATKLLFAKLKAQAPTSADVRKADGDDAGEVDEEEETAEQANSGRATRAKVKAVSVKKVPAKKGVGKSAAPKKAIATKQTAKAAPAEPVEEEEEIVEEEGDAQVEEDGKSTVSVSVVQISTPAITFTRPSIQSELESPPQAKNEKSLPPPSVESLTKPDSENGMDIDQEQDGDTERELEQKRLLDALSPEQKQSVYKSLYSRITNILKETSPAVQEPVLPYYSPATPMPTLSIKIEGLELQFTQEDINRAEFHELSLYDYLAWKLVNSQYFN